MNENENHSEESEKVTKTMPEIPMGKVKTRAQEYKFLNPYSMADLYEREFIDQAPVVEGYFLPGLYLLVGDPKVGKSLLALQLAYQVSMGMPVFGHPSCKGKVIYLALEDTDRRLQRRLAMMFGTECSENLNISTVAGSISSGLVGDLEQFMTNNPDTVLIIIDTLQMVRDNESVEYSYQRDYAITKKLKAFTDKYHVCMLLVHHSRKMASDNQFDRISGSNGLRGGTDGAYMLYTESNGNPGEAILAGSCRDMDDFQLTLKRDPKTLQWVAIGKPEKRENEIPDPELEAIVNVVKDKDVWMGTATELLEMSGLNMQPNQITRKLTICASQLNSKYHILFRKSRTHDSRVLTLQRVKPQISIEDGGDHNRKDNGDEDIQDNKPPGNDKADGISNLKITNGRAMKYHRRSRRNRRIRSHRMRQVNWKNGRKR